jgi:hypothetical protein
MSLRMVGMMLRQHGSTKRRKYGYFTNKLNGHRHNKRIKNPVAPKKEHSSTTWRNAK